MRNKISQNMLVVMMLGVILLLNILSVRHKTLTYDEGIHYDYGVQILKLNPDKSSGISLSKMPFSSLNAIPRGIGILLESVPVPGKFTNFLYDMKTGRYITILFSLLLAFYVFKWSKELYGFVPGLFSLVLYAFSPNVIAHSRLITTDLYATCMITISTYYFWQFIKFGGWKKAGLSAFTLGLAQLSKYTSVHLYPIFILILLVRYSGDLSKLIKTKSLKDLAKYSKVFFKFAVFFLVISIIIINIGFFFNKSFTPLGEYEFKSELFKSLQSRFILRYLPMPVPYPYLQGLDGVKFQEGERDRNIYLLGEIRGGDKNFKGFKGYYFYAFLFKAPIPVQLFILFSFVAYIVNRKKYNFWEDELFLLFPILFFTIYFNFFFKAQTGIRFFLVVFPFLHILCGSLLKNWETFGLKLKSAVIFLVIYLIISVLSYFPHYISYFNEFMWDRKQAYKILVDSNIDWGQNRLYLEKYKEEHPDIHINPDSPVAGRIVVGVNNLVGILDAACKGLAGANNKYKWLIDNFEPVDHIAYSYLVYDIPPEALEKIQDETP